MSVLESNAKTIVPERKLTKEEQLYKDELDLRNDYESSLERRGYLGGIRQLVDWHQKKINVEIEKNQGKNRMAFMPRRVGLTR